MDVLSGLPLDPNVEKRIYLHNHEWMAGSKTQIETTAEQFLRSVCSHVINQSTITRNPDLHRKFLWRYDQLYVNCPVCELVGERYWVRVDNIVKQLSSDQAHKFHLMFQQLVRKVDRHFLIEDKQAYDCIVCGLRNDSEGLAYPVQDEYYTYVAQCDTCQQMACYLCRIEWDKHQGKTCAEVQQQLAKLDPDAWAARKDSVKCPNCLANVQKVNGCNHMTCTCGSEFCYLCLRYYEVGHYREGPCDGRLHWKPSEIELWKFRERYADPSLNQLSKPSYWQIVGARVGTLLFGPLLRKSSPVLGRYPLIGGILSGFLVPSYLLLDLTIPALVCYVSCNDLFVIASYDSVRSTPHYKKWKVGVAIGFAVGVGLFVKKLKS